MSEHSDSASDTVPDTVPDTGAAARTFLHDLEFDYEATGDGMRGSLTLTPQMMASEADRPVLAVLASVADVFTGMPISIRHPRTVALTVDLVLRLLRPIPVGRYAIESTVVKHGRTVSVAEATISDHRRAVAHCWATFVPFTMPEDLPAPSARSRIGEGGGLRQPFLDALGIRVHAPGTATVDKRAYTLQPAGTIQGGVVCGLVEAAAGSILGQPLNDIDVRFLATVRHGPGRATAVRLDERTARVTVVDAGADDERTTAVAIARC